MASAFKWLFELTDNMSGPAKAIKNELSQVTEKLESSAKATKAADEALKKLQKTAQQNTLKELKQKLTTTEDPAQKAKIGLNISRLEAALRRDSLNNESLALNKIAQIKKAQLEAAESSAGAVVSSLHPALAVTGMILGTVKEIGSALLDIGVASSRFAIEQASFKQRNLMSLSVLTGSKQEAQDLYRWMGKLADLTPLEMKDVVPQVQGLLGAGLKLDEAKTIFAAVSDIAAASGNAAAGPAILAQITQALGKGTFDMEDLKVIASQSGGLVNIGRVFEQAAKSTGRSAKEVRENGLKVRTGIAALLKDVRENIDRGGKLGSMAEELGMKSLDGQISTLRSNFGRLFEDVNIEPIIGFLKNLNEVLDQNSESGKMFKETFETIFNEIFGGLFSQYAGSDGLVRLRADLQGLMEMFKSIAEAMKTFAEVAWVTLRVFEYLSGRNVIGLAENQLSPVLDARRAAQDRLLALAEQQRRIKELGAFYAGPTSPFVPTGGASVLASPFPEGPVGANSVLLPAHAKGGITTRGHLALVGEAGPEVIAPLDKLPALLGGAAGSAAAGVRVERLEQHFHIDGAGADAETLVQRIATLLPSALQSAFEQLATHAGAGPVTGAA